MSEQQLINYLLWMKERGQTVLVPSSAPGPVDSPERVPDIVAPPVESVQEEVAAPTPAPIPTLPADRAQYKVLFISLAPLSNSEHEMVSRIGAALKLEPSEFAIAAGEPAQKLFAEADAKAVVLMGEDAYPLVQARIHQTLLVISHPGAMLIDPQLKVTAWNALQKLKATL
ncbi:MAG: hypothetical protein EOP07_23225 [Proteobacteria bacterium]|nr:MAG: hypothetical protein EOP07_23225 [Pseudomonadota bacterium]